MSPGLWYWSGALLNMALVVGCLWCGVRAVRRQEVARHRRFMLTAVALVGLFIVSYGLKLTLLGREALELWSGRDVWVLRFHEACIAAMLLGGGTALTLALRLGFPIEDPSSRPDPERVRSRIRLHHRAGWTAVGAATLGIASAAAVLFGMFARA